MILSGHISAGPAGYTALAPFISPKERGPGGTETRVRCVGSPGLNANTLRKREASPVPWRTARALFRRWTARTNPPGRPRQSLSSGGSPLSADHREVRVERRQRVGADPDIEGLCLLDPLTGARAPVAELGRPRGKVIIFVSPGLSVTRSKPFSSRIDASCCRPSDGCRAARPRHHNRACVRHGGCHRHRAAHLHLGFGDLQVRDGEGCVAEAKAEGIER